MSTEANRTRPQRLPAVSPEELARYRGVSEATRRKRVSGEVVAFAKLMAALSTMKRKEPLSSFDTEVYEGATARIPLSILSRAVARLVQEQSWFPSVHELLGMCEAVRVEMRAAMVFEPCVNCGPGGWTEIEVGGVRRVTRCACWRAHMQKVEALGIPAEPLAFPAGED